MKDLHDHYTEIFEPELDGKTPVTIRGFDWYEDTSAEEYLIFNLLLERFAVDLLQNYGPEILPRFLELYRNNYSVLLSDNITDIFANILGQGGAEWLEESGLFLRSGWSSLIVMDELCLFYPCSSLSYH